MHPSGSNSDGWRLPAKELEATVIQTVRDLLNDELRLVDALELGDMPPDRLRRVIAQLKSAADELTAGPHERRRQLLSALLHRVTIEADAMRIEIKRSGVAGLLVEPNVAKAECSQGLLSLVIPIQLRRRGIEAKLVMHASPGRSSPPDPKLIMLLANAQRWIDDLAHGRATSVRELARQAGKDAGEVSRTLPLAFLAPDIVEAILAGRQPIELTPHQLKRIGALPHRWDDQRRRLGFTS